MRTIVVYHRNVTWIHYSDGVIFTSHRITNEGSEQHWSVSFVDWIDALEIAFSGDDYEIIEGMY